MKINTYCIIFLLFGAARFFECSLHAISHGELIGVRSIERTILFENTDEAHFSNTNSYIDALAKKIIDSDPAVRHAAILEAANLVVFLQQRKQRGEAIRIKSGTLLAFQNALFEAMQDSDPQVRRLAAGTLIYSDAPNKELESKLVAYQAYENDAFLRISVAQDMYHSGYKSAAIDAQILAALDDGDSQTRMEAVRAAGLARVAGALPKLAVLLSDDEMVKGYVVEAIAAYGSEAEIYLPQLEAMLASGTAGGTLINDLRRSIEAIRNPSPNASTQVQFQPVSLVDNSSLAASTKVAIIAPDPQVSTPNEQPKYAFSPSPSSEETKSSLSDFPFVPLAIFASLIAVILIYLFRRKSR